MKTVKEVTLEYIESCTQEIARLDKSIEVLNNSIEKLQAEQKLVAVNRARWKAVEFFCDGNNFG